MPSSIVDLRVSTSCGKCLNKCCSQPYDWVYLTESEVQRLEGVSGRNRAEFVVERRNEAISASFLTLALPCAFLSKVDGRCTVYDSRPLVCQLFPFYPDPTTGHLSLMPAQCGDNLQFALGPVEEAWGVEGRVNEIRDWVRRLWVEAGIRGNQNEARDVGSKTPIDGSP